MTGDSTCHLIMSMRKVVDAYKQLSLLLKMEKNLCFEYFVGDF